MGVGGAGEERGSGGPWGGGRGEGAQLDSHRATTCRLQSLFFFLLTLMYFVFEIWLLVVFDYSGLFPDSLPATCSCASGIHAPSLPPS